VFTPTKKGLNLATQTRSAHVVGNRKRRAANWTARYGSNRTKSHILKVGRWVLEEGVSKNLVNGLAGFKRDRRHTGRKKPLKAITSARKFQHR